MVVINFDTEGIALERKNFEALPAGWYKACIISSDLVKTKDGDGEYLKCNFEILEGKFTGRKIWQNFNLENKSRVAVEIGKAALAAVCKALGFREVRDTEELHNLPLAIKLKLKTNNRGEVVNEISGYKDKMP